MIRLKNLQYPLPEDIERLKGAGYYKKALKIIEARLEKPMPGALRKRLELEINNLKIIPKSYPYDHETALALMAENFANFKAEELDALRDENATDWIFLEGEVRYKDDFIANVKKTRAPWRERALKREDISQNDQDTAYLNQAIAHMKKHGSIDYRIHVRINLALEKEAQRPGEEILVHLPLPVEYDNVKNFDLLAVSPEMMDSVNRSTHRALSYCGPLKEDQVFSAEYRYVSHMDYIDLDPDMVYEDQPTFYTEELLPHIAFTPYIKAVAAELADGETNPLILARKIYDFITTKMIYSYVRPYATIDNIPQYALANLKGDCGVRALTFITLCRALGIPARWQAGLYASPIDVSNHDWAQFYLAPYGWIHVDCSFGGAAYRKGHMERWNFYFGNLDPFRIPSTADYQQPFYPPKKHPRIDPYDNQNGEAEYADRGLMEEELIFSRDIIDISLL